MAAGRITELLIVNEEQEKIAFKENRTHYFFCWLDGGTLKREWKSNVEELRLEATCGQSRVS